MIVTSEIETLRSYKVDDNVTLDSIIAKSKEMDKKWVNHYIDNTNAINYGIDILNNNGVNPNVKLILTAGANPVYLDITDYAFSQLCQRVGVPVKYIINCMERNEPKLAVNNLQTWIEKDKKGILVRESNGIARAVLSDSYVPFDNFQILKSLGYTMDKKRFIPTQVYLSQDKLHIRFVDYTPLPVSDGTGSPLYAGFILSSNSVGEGSFSLKFFIYREVCKNGLAISSFGGTLFKQKHIGNLIKEEKLSIFNKAFMNIDTLCEVAVDLIKKNDKKPLSDDEMEVLIQKAKIDLKLSKEKTDKLTTLINSTYNKTKWGFINGITELAQDFSLDTRYDIENWAGNYLAKIA